MRQSQTVLEKCGIPDELVEFLKIKGLVVPAEIKEVERPLISPSEEWFREIADKFTPQLPHYEREALKSVPFLLSLKIVNSEHTAIDTALVLQRALQRIDTLEDPEEKVAAILSILQIFHAALDYNILKYDRHLEYYEYEESPVGYVWKRFRELLLKAAPGSTNKDEWVRRKSLEILAAPKRVHFTQEYYFACVRVREMLMKKLPNLDELSEKDVLEKLEGDPVLEIIEEISNGFYKKLEEFIRDALLFRDSGILRKIRESKLKSKKALEDVCSRLNDEEAFELERIVEILEEFISIQEWEGSFGGGVHFRGKLSFWDVLFEAYDKLKSTVKNNVWLINPNVDKNTVLNLLEAEDVPSIFVANREIIKNIKYFFNENVVRIFNAEIERWVCKSEGGSNNGGCQC